LILAFIAVVCLVLIGLIVRNWLAGAYWAVSTYLGLLFMGTGVAVYAWRMAVLFDTKEQGGNN